LAVIFLIKERFSWFTRQKNLQWNLDGTKAGEGHLIIFFLEKIVAAL
jgi:hypothetical protein